MLLPYKIFFWLLCQGYAHEIPIHYAMDCLKKIDTTVQAITSHHNSIDPEHLAVIRNLSDSFQNEETKQLLNILTHESVIAERTHTLNTQEKAELLQTVEQLSESINKMSSTLTTQSKMVIHPADRTQMRPFTLDPRVPKICSMIQDACKSNCYTYARAASVIAGGIAVIGALCWWYKQTPTTEHDVYQAQGLSNRDNEGSVVP